MRTKIFTNAVCSKYGIYAFPAKMYHTFLSWPALANNLPSEEKWQQTTLLLLLRMEPTSLKEKPNVERQSVSCNQIEQSSLLKPWDHWLPFEVSAACSAEFRFSVPNKSLTSPSSFERKDSTLSSKEPTSPKGSMSSCNSRWSHQQALIYHVLYLAELRDA